MSGPSRGPGNKRLGLIVTVVGFVVLVLIVASSMKQAEVTCEICITYKGRSQCRTASATNEEDARRAAANNACTFLSSSMAESIACPNTPPDSVTCTP